MPRKYVKKPIGEGGRRSYKNSDAMIKAFDAVKESRLGIRQAAEIFEVDYHSLLRRVNDACPLTAGVGRFTLLSEKEEADLAKGIALCAEWGWGLRKDNVCSMVHHYLTSKGRGENGPPGPDWLQGFLSRHPNIVLRKTQQLSVVRIKSLTPDVGEKWLNCVEETYKKYQITRAEQVHNCDETGFSIDPAAGFVLAQKGSRVVTNVGGSGREQISVLGCCSAAGKMWPPLIIYKAKRMNVLWTSNGPPGTTFTVTDSGWMEADAFTSWFEKSFVPNVSSIEGNKVLIYDGHSSHISIPVIEAAIANKIVILRLPSHSSHVLQPLDVGVFGPMKKEWKKLLQDWQRKNRLAKISKSNFPSILNACWVRGFKAANAVSGFKATGLWPFSRKVLDSPEFKRSEPLKAIQAPNEAQTPCPTVQQRDNGNGTHLEDEEATGLQLKDVERQSVVQTPTEENTLKTPNVSQNGVCLVAIAHCSKDVPNQLFPNESVGNAGPSILHTPRGKENEDTMKEAFLEFFRSTSPPSNPNKRKSAQIRLFQYGECVTDSDMLERLREKEKEKVEKQKNKRGKKIKKANVKTVGQAKKKRESSSSENSSDEADNVDLVVEPLPELCEVCITDDEGVWVACNTCMKWYHVECAGLGDINKDQASLLDFVCYQCK